MARFVGGSDAVDVRVRSRAVLNRGDSVRTSVSKRQEFFGLARSERWRMFGGTCVVEWWVGLVCFRESGAW